MNNGVISLEQVVRSPRKSIYFDVSAIQTARTNTRQCSAAPSGAQALTRAWRCGRARPANAGLWTECTAITNRTIHLSHYPSPVGAHDHASACSRSPCCRGRGGQLTLGPDASARARRPRWSSVPCGHSWQAVAHWQS